MDKPTAGEFTDTQMLEALSRPVPNMDTLRKLKQGYNDLPIDTSHALFHEPVVALRDYHIAGQAYYSRNNAATGEPVPGVSPDLYLRKSVVETLAKINQTLQHPVISNLFGYEVELYVEDALRPVSLQRQLHDTLIPALLRRNHPGITDQQVASRLKDIIAIPSADPNRPSPHATGGALDVILRRKQTDPGYSAEGGIPMGHTSGDTSNQINPDYFETFTPRATDDKLAQRNRRAYYAIMTGAAFGIKTGLVNNPTEWWHWGSGDQLAARVRGDKTAYYSLAEPDHLT